MIDVIQIYKAKEIFTKSTYTQANRAKFHNMENTLASKQGYLAEKKLVLPVGKINQADLQAIEVIIIQDIIGWESFILNNNQADLNLPAWYKKSSRDFLIKNTKTLFALKQLNSPKSFEIFKLRKTENNSFELFLDYTANSMSIGVPARESHKLCDLKKNKPIRYKINGKSDFTMGGRKERTFYEFDIIIEWIGSAEKVEFREKSQVDKLKVIPLENAKLIDERKFLR